MTISLIVPFILGWLAGMIVNYLADVLPITRRLTQPTCLQCNTPISWKDYLFFQPCANNHARNKRTWITQSVIFLISIYIWFQAPKMGYWLGVLLLIYLGIVFVIDMEHRLILHPTSIIGSLLTLGLGTYTRGIVPTLLGGLLGFVILLAFYYFGVLFARLRAKRMQAQGLPADDEEALGAGDVILATVLGFLVGVDLIWFCILISILLGGIVSFFLIVWLIISGKYNKNALMMFIPYGPYFIISAFLMIYFPAAIQFFLPK
jgi:leader peptidase (prepilin peptidase)/N-methyltransferase